MVLISKWARLTAHFSFNLPTPQQVHWRKWKKIVSVKTSLSSGTTIISGAIAERTNFYFYIIFSVFNTFVFCLPARWLWAETGFLKTMGVVDLAGSCGVNLVGGAGAFVGKRLRGYKPKNSLHKKSKVKLYLTGSGSNYFPFTTQTRKEAFHKTGLVYYFFFPAAKMLGPRIGRWDSGKEPAMGSATNTIIGVFMLWWAWIAFNQVKTKMNVLLAP